MSGEGSNRVHKALSLFIHLYQVLLYKQSVISLTYRLEWGTGAMEIKDAIRQRRQEKIRQIQAQMNRRGIQSPVEAEQPSDTKLLAGRTEAEERGRLHQPQSASPPPEGEATRPIHPEPASRQMELHDGDPEQMWKRRRKSWREWEQLPSGNIALAVEGERPPPRSSGPNLTLLRKELLVKLLLSCLAFGAIWGMFHLDEPWAQEGQQFVRQALTEDMNFEAAAVWYESTFSGSPAFIPIFGDRHQQAEKVSGAVKEQVVAPVAEGSIVRSFAELLNGVEIAAADSEPVRAMQTGRVLLVSGDASGKTIVIQHGGKRLTIYSKLEESTVAQNDWVEAGDEIGRLQSAVGQGHSLLFFSVKEDERYVDPADVVPFG